ncbi:Na+/H+ antiporter subunit E [Alkaliphilus transvaalensis]|uniref:Na+/H+ antiporter subunit E n=1 Tax=Alkaliphilus transvaalensis TaxID=114628 RepID=UPI000686300D|nr:Na+/H+ antiporter subunit E [Alkaliphilus transvaalensis]
MKSPKGILSKSSLLLIILLFVFWLILSPALSLETVVLGLIASLGVVIFNLDLSFDENETSFYSIKGIIKLISFIGILLIEIVKANIGVAKIVLSPKMPISPTFVKVPLTLKKEMNRVLYANSITLTPGTLSVDINEDEILVHALTQEYADGMKGNILEKYITRLEEE